MSEFRISTTELIQKFSFTLRYRKLVGYVTGFVFRSSDRPVHEHKVVCPCCIGGRQD